MSIGVILIGMFLGLFAGALALVTGYSAFMVLWLYCAVGVLTVLSITVAFCAVDALQNRKPEPHQLA